MFKELFFRILILFVFCELLIFAFTYQEIMIEKDLAEVEGLTYQVFSTEIYLEKLEIKAKLMGLLKD